MSGRLVLAAFALLLASLSQPPSPAPARHPTLISAGVYLSPAVRDMPPQARRTDPPRQTDERRPPHRPSAGVADPVVQTAATMAATSQALGQWEGLGAGYPNYSVTAVPPDTNLAVGPNHIVQWVNNAFVVFDKTGRQLKAPVGDSTFWGNSNCNQLGGYSDPVVQYDRAANRWIVGEVAIPLLPGLFGQFAQCFAVSTGPDPTGTYYMWAYGFGTSINDYPKIGVWPDAYYVTWNIFQNSTTFTGAETCAWDRAAMLSGVAAPRFVCFQLSDAYASLLPSDLDGAVAPPPGSPNFLLNIDPGGAGTLNLWKFHVDFGTPANSTLTGPIALADAAPFTAACVDIPDCVPQPGTATKLDALGDRLMYRLAYRNFGGHESIVATHAVVTGSGAIGVRWYEVRSPNGAATVFQQGTFAPDGDHRWMSSIAMDQTGNIGVGYSVGSAATYPSIRYAGWEIGNPTGVLQDETALIAGGGSQTGYDRWGDYSAMRIDPSDDCTFWYTQEYQATTQDANWNSRIGSFRFPSCGGTLTPTSTTIASSAPVSSVGQPVTFTATVSPSTATGTVEFLDGGASLGSGTISNGTAVLTTATLASGTHQISATYLGSSSYAGSSSAALTQTVVGKTATTTTLSSDVNPAKAGRTVTFTARVSPAGATGTVEFKDGGTTLANVALTNGTATFSTAALTTGKHSITAIYSGDANFSGSQSAVLSQSVTGKK